MKKLTPLILFITLIFSSANIVRAEEMSFSDISVDIENAVIHDLALPQEWEGSPVEWKTDGTYIEADGTVNRPFPDDARDVVLTAEYGGNTKTFSVTVKAFESKKEIVETAALYLPFSAISSDDSNFVENDLVLPGEGLYNTKIIWISDNPSLIRIVSDNNGNYIGEVNRTYFGEGNYGVRLTAVFYYDNEFFEKYFYLNVDEHSIGHILPEKLTILRDAYRDEFIKRNSIFNLKSDLILPQFDTDILIDYSSENTDFITNTGVVKRDLNYDRRVEFTVTFTLSYFKTHLTIPLVVASYSNDEVEEIPELDLKNVLAQISREHNLNMLMDDISLKTVGDSGSVITWSTSDTSAMTNTGVITRGNEDKKVTLTATAEFKGHTYTESVDVVVRRITQSTVSDRPDAGDGGGSSGGRGESFSPSEPPVVNEKIYFTDLSSDHWAYENIMSLVDANVVSGYSDNSFKPDNAVTREEFVKMLLLATDNYKKGFNSNFGDVPKDSWYYTYVSCAYDKGIVQGTGEQYFGSGVKISRQDAAVMICRALGIESTAIDESAFPDFAQISVYAQSAVYTLYERGIVSGDGKGFFNPKNNITRAEVSKILDLVR